MNNKQTSILDKFKDRKITNNDIGEFLNIEREKYYVAGKRSPEARYANFPDFLGNTDSALKLIPAGWVVFAMTNDPVSVEDHWLVTLREINHDIDAEGFTLIEDTHKVLPRAIIGAILQIKELHL